MSRGPVNRPNRFRAARRLLPEALVALLLLICFSTHCPAATVLPPDLSRAEIMRLGERMYRDGILPSGKVMDAFIRYDVEVDSSAFSCSSCHLRAGLGSFEGGVITPPTTGNKLYKPYRRPPSLGDTADQAGRFIYAKTVLERPAYTRESLAVALRSGIDPAGQVFNDVMPRYPLSDRDMAILISYLELLSDSPSPGADSKGLSFATIISDDVSQEQRQALLKPLQQFIAGKNQQVAMYESFIKYGYAPTADMKYAFSSAALDVWELKGAPQTWKKQLAAHHDKQPVFAVLGGISNNDWRPVHEFCEEQRLPCLFPITDFPVVSDNGWYTYYFSKGYSQEGEAAARYLNRLDSLPANTDILQIVQDSPAGKALAAGFQKVWQELGRPELPTFTLTAEQLRQQDALDKLLALRKPGVLLLWADSGLAPVLPALIPKLAAPQMVMVSSGYFGTATASIAEAVREKVYITYPYRLTPYVGSKEGGFDFKMPVYSSFRDFGKQRIESLTTTMLSQVVLRGLGLLYDNLHRDHLLDVMSMQMDVVARDYERLSFGPGQRFTSKGCYIIQLGPGPEPALLPRSEWVMH